MAMNDKFRAGMARSIAKTKSKTEQYFQKLILDIDRSIILKSPVDTGRFRANWVVGINSINTNTNFDVDPNGIKTISNIQSEIVNLKINGQTIYTSNSLPYASRLEYQGWSAQAPSGMVRITLAELNSISTKVAYEIKGLK